MKKILIISFCLILILTGCNKETINGSDYKKYKCYDTHLFCLDAQDETGFWGKKYDNEWHSIFFRKPVGVSDEQFICAKVESRFSHVNIVVMQNPNNYVDVLQDWTIKEIEIYYISMDSRRVEGISKRLVDEEEPARTPAGIIASTTDSSVFTEFKDFVLSSTPMDEETTKVIWGPDKKKFESEIHESVEVYIRVHFNESENIVWDSEIKCGSYEGDQNRYIMIDVGRTPLSFSDSKYSYTNINEWSTLHEWLSGVMDEFNN